MGTVMAETPVSEQGVYSARPTVRVDTQEFPKVTELVLAMKLSEQEGGMSSLDLRLKLFASYTNGVGTFAFEDGQILRLGARIAVYGGDENAPREIFQGIITGLEAIFPADEGVPELVVLAEDVFQRARLDRRSKVHQDASLARIARELAERLSLTPVITGFAENKTIGTQVQLNESDLAFLRRLLRRYDGDLQVVGTELHVSPRNDVQRGKLDLELHFGQLRQARVIADLSDQVTSLTVTGWNALAGQRVKGTSEGAHLGPGKGRTGAEVLQQAIGPRAHHVTDVAAPRPRRPTPSPPPPSTPALGDSSASRGQPRAIRRCGSARSSP
jgi:uncharacterized protein